MLRRTERVLHLTSHVCKGSSDLKYLWHVLEEKTLDKSRKYEELVLEFLAAATAVFPVVAVILGLDAMSLTILPELI